MMEICLPKPLAGAQGRWWVRLLLGPPGPGAPRAAVQRESVGGRGFPPSSHPPHHMVSDLGEDRAHASGPRPGVHVREQTWDAPDSEHNGLFPEHVRGEEGRTEDSVRTSSVCDTHVRMCAENLEELASSQGTTCNTRLSLSLTPRGEVGILAAGT